MEKDTAHKYFQFNYTVVPVVQETEDDYWFVANVIAEAIGYKNPRQAASDIIRRNPEDFADCTSTGKVLLDDQEREVTLLNEEGIYAFCMLAKTKEAVHFRKIVATKIKEWRKQISAPPVQPPSALQMAEQQLAMFTSLVNSMKVQEQAIEEVKEEVADLRRGLIDINQPLREQFVEICRKTAVQANMDFRDVFNRVYFLIREQKHLDIKRRAKNRSERMGTKVRPVDILDQMGMLGYAIQLAKAVQADLNPRSGKWNGEPDPDQDKLSPAYQQIEMPLH